MTDLELRMGGLAQVELNVLVGTFVVYYPYERTLELYANMKGKPDHHDVVQRHRLEPYRTVGGGEFSCMHGVLRLAGYSGLYGPVPQAAAEGLAALFAEHLRSIDIEIEEIQVEMDRQESDSYDETRLAVWRTLGFVE